MKKKQQSQAEKEEFELSKQKLQNRQINDRKLVDVFK